jgi:hypothetical protein
MGVVIPATLPNVLNKPALRPGACRGDASDTTAHPSEPIPLPKKASAINVTTTTAPSTKLQTMITVDSSMPAMMEIFRASAREAGVFQDSVGNDAAHNTSQKPAERRQSRTLLKNHVQAIVACDFFVAVTSTFRVMYVVFIIEHHSRRLVHYNVTCDAQKISVRRRSRMGRFSSSTRQRVLVVQSTEYCLGMNRAQVVESMPRRRQRHGRILRRIGNARVLRKFSMRLSESRRFLHACASEYLSVANCNQAAAGS